MFASLLELGYVGYVTREVPPHATAAGQRRQPGPGLPGQPNPAFATRFPSVIVNPLMEVRRRFRPLSVRVTDSLRSGEEKATPTTATTTTMPVAKGELEPLMGRAPAGATQSLPVGTASSGPLSPLLVFNDYEYRPPGVLHWPPQAQYRSLAGDLLPPRIDGDGKENGGFQSSPPHLPAGIPSPQTLHNMLGVELLKGGYLGQSQASQGQQTGDNLGGGTSVPHPHFNAVDFLLFHAQGG